MNEQPTRPVDIPGAPEHVPTAWQRTALEWSFGPTVDSVAGWPEAVHPLPEGSAVNRACDLTIAPQEHRPPLRAAPRVPRRAFGRRSLAPISHWEGVVERVSGDRFFCRLTPLNDDDERNKVEFTEFEVDDLANESDIPLVQPGAIFYWTIGRARNAAGTITNVSLVRFRRLPLVTAYQRKRAEREAEDTLEALGGDDRLDTALD
jgi:hypothetical protein